jgi:hypothetical protein
MAINYLSSINLNKNELQNAVLHPLATAPSLPATGQVYYDSTDEKIYVYDGTDWQPVGDVHTIEGNSINLNGTVSASLPGASSNPPLVQVHESDDGTNEGADGDHDHGVVDLRVLETDNIYEEGTNSGKGEFLVRSKYIFDYIKEYVTISGTAGEIDVFSDDSALANNGLNPGITEDSIIKIGLPADVVIQNNASVNAPGESDVDGEASLTVKGTTELGRDGSASVDTITIHGDTTLGTASNDVDLTVNGDFTAGVAGATNTIQINGDTDIGDASNEKDLTVWGDLTVKGTTTTVDSETVTIADNIILLNSNATGNSTENAGIEIERGDLTNVQLRWNGSDEKWQITEDGSAYENIVTGNDQFVTSVGDGSSNSFTVQHNLGTKDVIVQVYETSSGDTVMLDVTRPTNNTVTITLANIASNIPATNGLRVLIQKLY